MIIAINGKKGSGKNLVGEIIQYFTRQNIDHTGIIHAPDKFKKGITQYPTKGQIESFGNLSGIQPTFQIKKFADSVTKAFKIITGIDYHKLNREEKEKVRPLYSKFAEGQKDIFGNGVWVKALINTYIWDKVSITDSWIPSYSNPDNSGGHEEAEPVMPKWIITDLLFPVELKAIEVRGGITIKINRDEQPIKDRVYIINNRFDSKRKRIRVTTSFDIRDSYEVIYRLWDWEIAKEALYSYNGDILTMSELYKEIYEDTGEYPLDEYANKTWRIQDTEEHISETALDDNKFNYYIDNNGTIKELVEKVKAILLKEKLI